MNRVFQFLPTDCPCQQAKRIAQRLRDHLNDLESRIEFDDEGRSPIIEFLKPSAGDIADGAADVGFHIFYSETRWPVDDDHAANAAEVLRQVANDLCDAAARLEGGCQHG